MARDRTPAVGPRRNARRRTGRRRLATLAAAAGALVVAGAAGAAPSRPGEPGQPDQQGQEPQPDAVVQLQGEIEAMRDGGLPADHPKVDMLEAEVDGLIRGSEAEPVPDPGMEEPPGGSGADTPQEAARAVDGLGRVPAETGTVECEPVPQMLTVDEVAEARCLSVPQPDGGNRYVVARPSGEVHVVGLNPGGQVERLPDRELPGDAGGAAELVPDQAGDVRVMVDGAEVATLDLGS